MAVARRLGVEEALIAVLGEDIRRATMRCTARPNTCRMAGPIPISPCHLGIRISQARLLAKETHSLKGSALKAAQVVEVAIDSPQRAFQTVRTGRMEMLHVPDHYPRKTWRRIHGTCTRGCP